MYEIFLDFRTCDKSASFCICSDAVDLWFKNTNNFTDFSIKFNLHSSNWSTVWFKSMQMFSPLCSYYWRSFYSYSQKKSSVLNNYRPLHSSGLTDFPKFAVQFLWLQYSERLSSSRRNRSRIYQTNIHTGFLIKSAHSRLQVVQLICQVMTVYVIHECTIIPRL